jgi:hypothetical protein
MITSITTIFIILTIWLLIWAHNDAEKNWYE